MRSLLLLSFLSVSMFAQQQLGSDQQAKNEEDACCCTTYDTNVCLSKVKEKVDKELNVVYQSVLKRRHDDPENAELRDAEKARIACRDATCKAEAGLYRGGSIMPTIEFYCVLRVSRQRIADLKNAYLFDR